MDLMSNFICGGARYIHRQVNPSVPNISLWGILDFDYIAAGFYSRVDGWGCFHENWVHIAQS